jgi:hypothetical protein
LLHLLLLHILLLLLGISFLLALIASMSEPACPRRIPFLTAQRSAGLMFSPVTGRRSNIEKKGLNSMPHVILFEHAQFHGAHKHVVRDEPNLNAADDNFFNDITSSIVVLEGDWEFFEDSGHVGKLGKTLGPGHYAWVEDANALGPGSNDKVSSLRPVKPT